MSEAFLYQSEDEDLGYGTKKTERKRKTYVAAAFFVLLAVVAVCAGASYALIYRADEGSPATEEAFGENTEEGALLEESYPSPSIDYGATETTSETSTASVVTRGRSTATVSASSSPPRTTEARSTRVTRRPFFTRWPLLCTIGSRAVLPAQYPPDGLCDFMFYTHVFLDEERSQIMSTSNDSFEVFAAMAVASNRTYYGISFNTDLLTTLRAALNKDATNKELSELSHGNIQHYGILDIRGSGTHLDEDMENVLSTLRVLKTLKMRTTPRTPDERIYLALGIELTRHQHEVSRLPTLLASATGAGAELLVIRTHVSTWNMEEDKGTAGATMLHNPRGIQKPDMNTTLAHLQLQRFRGSILMVSFTMGAAFFTMPTEWANVTDRDIEHRKPTNFSVVDYGETCTPENADAVRVHPESFVVGGNTDRHYQLIYEDETTLSEKIKYTHRYVVAHSQLHHFGWALFDVDREDHNDTCGAGKSFARLKAARNAVPYGQAPRGKRRNEDWSLD